MYRVIVVDDEMLIRKRICLGFDWASLGFEVAADTGDGEQALAMILSGGFDLAIVDIAMPGMNGIELVRRIREEKNPLRVIFLTGHSDFAYAKEAIRYGVCSYVLKPVNEDEFIGILSDLREELDRERKDARLRASLTDSRTEMMLYMEFRALSGLLDGASVGDLPEEAIEKASSMGLLTGRPYCLLSIKSDTLIPEGEAGTWQRYQELVEIGRQVFCDRPFSVFFHLREGCCVFYVNEIPAPGDADFLRQMENDAKKLVGILNARFGGTHTCGISSRKTSFSEIRPAWQESRSALSNVNIFRKNVMLWDDLRDTGRRPFRVSSRTVRELQNLILSNDTKGCRNLVETVFRDMRENRCSYEDILLNVNSLLYGAAEESALFGLEIRWLMGCTSVDTAFEKLHSPEEMKEWFRQLLDKIIESRSFRDSKKRDIPLVTKSCEYLKAHSRDNRLTQASVAEALGVTPAYLSDLFKKSMGVSMMNYLTMIRLENARTLLTEDPGLPLRAVAEQVGYSDEFYFSKSFKKYYGVSPSRIRDRGAKTGDGSPSSKAKTGDGSLSLESET